MADGGDVNLNKRWTERAEADGMDGFFKSYRTSSPVLLLLTATFTLNVYLDSFVLNM